MQYSSMALALMGMTSMANGLVARSAGSANTVVNVILGLEPTQNLTDYQQGLFPNGTIDSLYLRPILLEELTAKLVVTNDSTEALIFRKNGSSLTSEYNEQDFELVLQNDTDRQVLRISSSNGTAFNPNSKILNPSSAGDIFPGFHCCIAFAIQLLEDISQATYDHNNRQYNFRVDDGPPPTTTTVNSNPGPTTTTLKLSPEPTPADVVVGH